MNARTEARKCVKTVDFQKCGVNAWMRQKCVNFTPNAWYLAGLRLFLNYFPAIFRLCCMHVLPFRALFRLCCMHSLSSSRPFQVVLHALALFSPPFRMSVPHPLPFPRHSDMRRLMSPRLRNTVVRAKSFTVEEEFKIAALLIYLASFRASSQLFWTNVI